MSREGNENVTNNRWFARYAAGLVLGYFHEERASKLYTNYKHTGLGPSSVSSI